MQVNYLHFRNESEATVRGGKPALWLPWQHHHCKGSDGAQFYLFHSISIPSTDLLTPNQVLPGILLLILKGH